MRTLWSQRLHPLRVRLHLRGALSTCGGIVNFLSGLSSSRLLCDTLDMSRLSINRHKDHRFPAEIISHGVWLYFRFYLSYSRCRRAALCTRRHGDLRSYPQVVPQVRAGVCASTPAPASPARRQVASGRSLPHDQRSRQHRYLNNRAQTSHQPMRERERRMGRFKSPGHAQCFLSAYGPFASHFRPRRHLFAALAYRQEMRRCFQTWREITGTATAA
jgi:hypothetical protein